MEGGQQASHLVANWRGGGGGQQVTQAVEFPQVLASFYNCRFSNIMTFESSPSVNHSSGIM